MNKISNTNQPVSQLYRDNPFWDKDVNPRVVEASMTNGRLMVDFTAPYPQKVCNQLSLTALLLECVIEQQAGERDFEFDAEWTEVAQEIVDEIRKDLAV